MVKGILQKKSNSYDQDFKTKFYTANQYTFQEY